MNKRVLSALMGLLTLAGIQTTVVAQTFKIATISPDGTSWMVEMRKAGKTIEERTDGRVKFKFYPGGVMGNDAAVLRKVRYGQLNGGAFTAGSLVPVYPDAQLYSLPFIFRSHEEVAYVRSKMDDKIRAGLERNKMTVLGMSGGGFARVFSDVPVRETSDLAKKKVWVPEGDLLSEAALKAAGVSPVPLPLSDVYTGLQTGLVDTVGSIPSGLIALQWHTKVKYMTEVQLGYLFAYLVVDSKQFNKLSAVDRKVVLEVMRPAFDRLDQQSRVDNDNALKALEKLGIETVEPTAEAEQNWRDLGDQTIEKLSDAGQYSQSMLREMQQHLQDFRSK